MKPELRVDEEAAFTSSYSETLAEWRRGVAPTFPELYTHFNSLFVLSKQKEEVVTDVQHDKNGELVGTVRRTRSAEKVSSYEFLGKLFALSNIAKLTAGTPAAPGNKKTEGAIEAPLFGQCT